MVSIDATIVRAHQHSAGKKNRDSRSDDRILATEFVAFQLPITQQIPKTLSGIGHVGAQVTDKNT